MIRDSFAEQLQGLVNEAVKLGRRVEEALTHSVQILSARDHEAARELIAQDRSINKRRYEIEYKALTLIATQQPMAGDLRMIAAVLELVTELERMGDYAKGIAKIDLMIEDEPLTKPLNGLQAMASKTVAMLDASLEAFARQDAELARRIPPRDDEVDEHYHQIFTELIGLIMDQPDRMEQANYLLWAAHNLERAADRVTNICERVVFTATGELTELDVEEGQRISFESLE